MGVTKKIHMLRGRVWAMPRQRRTIARGVGKPLTSRSRGARRGARSLLPPSLPSFLTSHIDDEVHMLQVQVVHDLGGVLGPPRGVHLDGQPRHVTQQRQHLSAGLCTTACMRH